MDKENQIDKKNEENEIELKESGPVFNYSSKKRRFLNKLNTFLNNNFQYVFLVLLFFVFWFSFYYIILPKYNSITVSSIEVIEYRKDLFVSEYKKLIDYKNLINFYESIDKSHVEKIEKIIPERYSREDLFVEFTYFLMKNNFNIKSIKISDLESSISPVGQGSASRRLNVTIEDNESDRSYQSLLDIPSDVGVWLIKAEISNVNYTDLKYLADIIEDNLKLVDIMHLSFDPSAKSVSFDALTYYKK